MNGSLRMVCVRDNLPRWDTPYRRTIPPTTLQSPIDRLHVCAPVMHDNRAVFVLYDIAERLYSVHLHCTLKVASTHVLQDKGRFEECKTHVPPANFSKVFQHCLHRDLWTYCHVVSKTNSFLVLIPGEGPGQVSISHQPKL